MPESTCLHIQDRESGPIRVVELHWISVRIGRAAFCEVHLPDDRLADEACRLTRKGRTWSLIPSSSGRGPVLIEGRPLNGPCRLPFDVPFRLGPYCLTLRNDVAAEPDWELYPATEPPALIDAPPAAEAAAEEPVVAEEIGASQDTDRAGSDPDRWRARWKAAEAHLKARSARLAAGGQRGSAAISPEALKDADRPLYRPPSVSPPSVERPAPAPNAPRIEPAWTPPRPDAGLAMPRVGPTHWPEPQPAVTHPVPKPTQPAAPVAAEEWASNESLLPKAGSGRAGGVSPPSSQLGQGTDAPRSPFGTDSESLFQHHHSTDVGWVKPTGQEVEQPIGFTRPSGPASEPLRWAEPADVEAGESVGFTDPTSPPSEVVAWVEPTGDEVEQSLESGHLSGPLSEAIPWAELADDEAGSFIDIDAGDPVGFAVPTGPAIEPSETERLFPEAGSRRAGSVSPLSSQLEPGADAPHSPFGTDSDDDEAPSSDDESSYSIGAISDEVIIASPRRPIVSRPRSRARSGVDSPAGPTRPMDRGPRRRKPPRRPRRQVEAPESSDDEPASAPGIDAGLPSVQDILATHRNSPGPRPAVERSRRGTVALPTVPREPGQWLLPGWLALSTVGTAAVGIGLIACVLSWWWAMDASNASIVTHRLLAGGGSGRRWRLPEGFQPPGGRWVKTTAQHLAHWAIYNAGAEPEAPRRTPEVWPILTHALDVSPLNPTARLAMSQLEGRGGDGPGRIRGLGLSRDSVSLAWSARRLMDSGRKEASLRLYHRALVAAADGGLSRSVTPRFADDDPAALRHFYLLPSEDAVRDIVVELAARVGLEFREWSRALPRNPIVLLATARLLREKGSTEADALLDEILGDDWGATEQGPVDPRLLAARGEALILRSRWPEAAKEYQQAIDRVDNELIRRSWWFNLADIAQRLNDEGQRQAALRAALAVNSSDDISRRVGLLLKSGDAKINKPRAGYGTVRTN
jgi:hypothetical protein